MSEPPAPREPPLLATHVVHEPTGAQFDRQWSAIATRLGPMQARKRALDPRRSRFRLALYPAIAALLLLHVRATDRVRITLGLGAGGAPEATSPNGSIGSRAFTARLGASVALTRPGAGPSLLLGARVCGYALHMVGDPSGTARGASADGAAVTIEGGPSLFVPLGPRGTAFIVDGGIAGAIHGVVAGDAGIREVGLTGIAGVASLGIVAGAL